MRADRAFTLLEVLAAVAILGLVYVALSAQSIAGIAMEGDARRLMEASLIADQELAQLETQLFYENAPPLGLIEEEVEEPYRVELEVLPYVFPESLGPLREREDDSAPSLFGDARGARPGAVRQVQVRVFWPEGLDEAKIERTTFLVDASAASEVAGTGLAGSLLEELGE